MEPKMNDDNEIRYRLKRAREKAGFKQEKIAEILGISRAGYSRMETGKVNITSKHLKKIAETFNISIDWLIFGKEGDQTKQNPNFSDFGEYGEVIKIMLSYLKEDEMMMNAVLSYFFQQKGEKASEKKNHKKKEGKNGHS
jgi:transcriptional regulator with XRE-family HTH domain